MDTSHIIIFDDIRRMNILIDGSKRLIGDVTLCNGTPELVEVMELISHRDIKQAIKCLACNATTDNQKAKQIIDILQCYN